MRLAHANILVVGLAACEAQRLPFNTELRDAPMVLGLRLEVVEAGPNSDDLFPVPADRVRAEPLPGDVVVPRAWIADVTGELDPEVFDPQWMLCYRGSDCLPAETSTSCEDAFPDDVACLLGRGASPRAVVPALDPDRDWRQQAGLRLAFVGAEPGVTTTDACMAKLRRRPLPVLTGCLRAEASISIGPLGRLAELAGAIDLPEADDLPSEQPNYNPELGAFPLAAADNDDEFLVVRPGVMNEIPSERLYSLRRAADDRDAQLVIYPTSAAENGPFGYYERLETLFWVDRPGTYAGLLFTPADGEFSLYGVIEDDRGGRGWARYDFVVAGP
jgi:hypothetical protein